MYQAVRFDRLGGPEVLQTQQMDERQPGAGEVSLKVEAVGLNRAESMYYHGLYFEHPELPSGIGYEAVGIVTSVGAGVDPSLVRHRFGTIPGYSMNRYPVLAEMAVVPASVLAPIPESLSVAEGAASWMQYCTAYGALVPAGKVAGDDFVLVTAASSSVGLAAIQIIKAEGGISIATTRTAAKKQKLLDLGADHVIVMNEDDLVQRVAEITGGKGARIVFDPVGGNDVNTLGQAAANGGVIFIYGMLSGQPTPLPLSIFGRRIAMYGYTFNELRDTPDWEVMKQYIYDHLAEGSFKPEIARSFYFAEAVEAYRYLESNDQVGKVVITF